MAESAPAEPERIPIARPAYGPEELEAVQAPVKSGWIVQGPQVERFEQLFGEFISSPHAIATTSCTTALHLAVAAIGLEPDREVIVPAFTWIPTANVVEYMGSRPVFADIELETFNIDPQAIEPLVNERTAGLIPVHLFGLCADMTTVNAVAEAHDLWVVEDAACAFGASLDGRHAGTLGDAGCFSFHARKAITTGEGGMLTTADDDLARVARSLRDHGASRSDLDRERNAGSFLPAEYHHVGFNYRMTDIQGALGVAQMGRADWILAERARLAARYDELLAGLDWLAPPTVPDGYVHGWQSYVCLYRPEPPTLDNVDRLGERRNALMLRLEQRGIATRQGTHAPALTHYYRERYGLTREQFPNTAIAELLSITLPLFPGMTDAQQDRVVDELTSANEG